MSGDVKRIKFATHPLHVQKISATLLHGLLLKQIRLLYTHRVYVSFIVGYLICKLPTWSVKKKLFHINFIIFISDDYLHYLRYVATLFTFFTFFQFEDRNLSTLPREHNK